MHQSETRLSCSILKNMVYLFLEVPWNFLCNYFVPCAYDPLSMCLFLVYLFLVGWFCLMAYQPFWVTQCQTVFMYIWLVTKSNLKKMIWTESHRCLGLTWSDNWSDWAPPTACPAQVKSEVEWCRSWSAQPPGSFPQALHWGGCPRGVMVKAMDCGIVVSESVLQLRYYVHFRTNTLGKGMNPLILPAMG